MPSPVNQIRKHFADLGYRITVRTLDKTSGKIMIGLVEMPAEGTPHRFENLLEYYFTKYKLLDSQFSVVNGDNFSPDGHGNIDVCRKCGCIELDACTDHRGRSCYWVEQDLCSLCATEEQKEEANGGMAMYMEGIDE